MPSQRRNTSVNLGLSSSPEKARLQYDNRFSLLCFEKSTPRWLNKDGINCIINERVSWVIEQNLLFGKDKANTQLNRGKVFMLNFTLSIVKRGDTIYLNSCSLSNFVPQKNSVIIVHFCFLCNIITYILIFFCGLRKTKIYCLYIPVFDFFFTSTKLKLWSLPSVGNQWKTFENSLNFHARVAELAHLCVQYYYLDISFVVQKN